MSIRKLYSNVHTFLRVLFGSYDSTSDRTPGLPGPFVVTMIYIPPISRSVLRVYVSGLVLFTWARESKFCSLILSFILRVRSLPSFHACRAGESAPLQDLVLGCPCTHVRYYCTLYVVSCFAVNTSRSFNTLEHDTPPEEELVKLFRLSTIFRIVLISDSSAAGLLSLDATAGISK